MLSLLDEFGPLGLRVLRVFDDSPAQATAVAAALARRFGQVTTDPVEISAAPLAADLSSRGSLLAADQVDSLVSWDAQAAMESGSVPAMKAALRSAGVDFSGCVEKQDLVELLERLRDGGGGADPCAAPCVAREENRGAHGVEAGESVAGAIEVAVYRIDGDGHVISRGGAGVRQVTAWDFRTSGCVRLLVPPPPPTVLAAIEPPARRAKLSRDGPGEYHLTVFTAAECRQLRSAGVTPELLAEAAEGVGTTAGTDWRQNGLGVAVAAASPGSGGSLQRYTIYVVVEWPPGQAYRARFGLGPAEFHVTIGFDPVDVHAVPKGGSSGNFCNLYTLFAVERSGSFVILKMRCNRSGYADGGSWLRR